MRTTPQANLIPEMQALFLNMQYETDARMIEIARMASVKKQMRALLDTNRKKDVPSTVAPMWCVAWKREQFSHPSGKRWYQCMDRVVQASTPLGLRGIERAIILLR